MKTWKFFKTAIKDYWRVSAILPYSKYAVKKIMKEVRPEHKFIIEYGSGSGNMTEKLLAKIPAGGKVVAVEFNKDFVNELNKIKDQRLMIINQDAVIASRNLNLPRIDIVISTIPLSRIGWENKKELLENTFRALAPGGLFITCQDAPVKLFPILRKLSKKVS